MHISRTSKYPSHFPLPDNYYLSESYAFHFPPFNSYYLSKSWAGNLRRYVEAQARRRRSPSFASSSNPNISAGSLGVKAKRSRGRERAESNLMPPWEDVNADIMCQHRGLAHSSQGTRGKVYAVRFVLVVCSGWMAHGVVMMGVLTRPGEGTVMTRVRTRLNTLAAGLQNMVSGLT